MGKTILDRESLEMLGKVISEDQHLLKGRQAHSGVAAVINGSEKEKLSSDW